MKRRWKVLLAATTLAMIGAVASVVSVAGQIADDSGGATVTTYEATLDRDDFSDKWES
jgi:hypothetical protein